MTPITSSFPKVISSLVSPNMGTINEAADRFVYNAVPDFIDFHIGDFHWFIFNPADIFISLGVLCLILDEFFFKNRRND